MAFFNSYSGVQDDIQQEKRNRIRSYGVSLLIIVLAFLFLGNTFRSSIDVRLDESGLILTSGSEYTVTIAYEDIVSIELADSADPGTLVEGTETSTEYSGVWKNDRWGEYSLFINPKLSRYLIFTTADGSVTVFNYQSDSSTESFYDSFCTMLEEYGLAEQATFTSFQDAE